MQRLLEQLHENNEAAFAEIYRLIHQKIYNFIFRYVQDPANAKELTQRFFVKLWEKRHSLSKEKPLESQAFVIARNLVIDDLRKSAREAAFKLHYQSRHNTFSLITEEALLFDNLQEHFEAAIEALPQKRKEIFQLNRYGGHTYVEIAHQLSISPKTVETQMSKALKVLRAKLSTFLTILL
ncbi:MAG: RNA polymerase sigma-70 factor [Saprospiraceae bacterium]